MAELYRGITQKYPGTLISVWGISHSGHQMDNLDPNLFPVLKGFNHFHLIFECQ